jgi:hypothetical protein
MAKMGASTNASAMHRRFEPLDPSTPDGVKRRNAQAANKELVMSAKATIDHDTIRAWVQKHGGCPAHVKSTGRKEDPGLLRIDFPGFSGQQSLEQISWDEFFEKFDANELALVYQDENRFNKLVSRDSVKDRLDS